MRTVSASSARAMYPLPRRGRKYGGGLRLQEAKFRAVQLIAFARSLTSLREVGSSCHAPQVSISSKTVTARVIDTLIRRSDESCFGRSPRAIYPSPGDGIAAKYGGCLRLQGAEFR